MAEKDSNLPKPNSGRGGKREGAGRKPKSIEVQLIQTLDKYIDSDLVANKVMDIIENTPSDKTRLEAIKLYYSYRYGRPTERKDISITKEMPIFSIDAIDVDFEE